MIEYVRANKIGIVRLHIIHVLRHPRLDQFSCKQKPARFSPDPASPNSALSHLIVVFRAKILHDQAFHLKPRTHQIIAYIFTLFRCQALPASDLFPVHMPIPPVLMR